VTEADVADARSLCEPGQIRDRDTDDPVDGVDVVELQCVDDQVDPIGESTRSPVPPASVSRMGATVMVWTLPGCWRLSLLINTFHVADRRVQDLLSTSR